SAPAASTTTSAPAASTTTSAPAATTTAATSTTTTTTAAAKPAASTTSSANTYPVGQCTWGVKSLASWVGNYWGNANQWVASAQAAGHSVGTTPKVGAVAVWPYDGGYGHVAYVSAVQSSTNIQVMEANY